MKNILLIDNFDSFTFNLVDFFETAGANLTIVRNNIAVKNIHPEHFDLLLLSPGPSMPKNAGNLMPILEKCIGKIPLFGVCLGQEALAEVFGGTLDFVPPVHGKASPIFHDEKGAFSGLPQGFSGGRYHSLAVKKMPTDFEISAKTEEGIIMGMRHKTLPIESVQFHPESVLTMKNNNGQKMITNVVEKMLVSKQYFDKPSLSHS